QLPPFFSYPRQADGTNAEERFRAGEVDPRLLLLWLDLEQDHVLRVRLSDDRVAQQLDVVIVVQPAKGRGPISRDGSKRPAHAAEEHELKRIQARKGLQFDQPRNQTALLDANAKINNQELRV